jgi:stalled ribosome rescue protein Dom34
LTFQKRYRRGYPVAVLLGLKEDQAVLWKVYSQAIKPEKTIVLDGNRIDSKAVYNFHESIINALRPALIEGVKSIVVASPLRSNYTPDFIRHVKDHHGWLIAGPNKAAFAEVTGAATTIHEVTTLTRTPQFRKIIGQTTTAESENTMELLEKRLNAQSQEPLVLYSFIEIEDKILGPSLPSKPEPEYLLLTDTYLSSSRQKNRVQRLIQIATNKRIKTKIVNSKTPSGKRLSQLGGAVCILREKI